jgi:hypothetical protein
MEIMCLNGWGGKLHEVLLPYLNTATPDVLCLQEVVHSPTSDKDWLTYRDGDHVLPQRANLFRDVCRVLPNHHAIFCPHAQGTLWDGEMELPSQFGIATFVHKSLTIIGQTQSFVHKDYSPNGYGSHPRSRNAHGVRVYDDNACRAVSITHMHGLRDLRGKNGHPRSRKTGAKVSRREPATFPIKRHQRALRRFQLGARERNPHHPRDCGFHRAGQSTRFSHDAHIVLQKI